MGLYFRLFFCLFFENFWIFLFVGEWGGGYGWGGATGGAGRGYCVVLCGGVLCFSVSQYYYFMLSLSLLPHSYFIYLSQ